MYSKKNISTYLFSTALISLITLILPFVAVGLTGSPATIIKIFYYIFISIYVLCLVCIVLIGIFNLFKNNYMLAPLQEICSYVALIMLLINTLIILPISNTNLSVGYSILLLETFLMACFNNIFRLIKELPRCFKSVSKYLKERKEQKQKILEEKQKLEDETKKDNHQLKLDLDSEDGKITITEDSSDEVKIIPPDEDMV